MPQRPIWRGHLRLALVSCPVALYSANHERGSLHFNLINPDTGNRVRMITQDAETGAELQRRDLVKGYEFKKDTYLVMNDEDFESARVESSSTIKIEKFVDGGSIDPIRFESSYYLAPDGDAGTDVYVVLRDAIAATGKSALARVVIARRERAIAIMPLATGLVAHTLHEDRELNDYGELFAGLPGGKPDPEMITLAKQLITRQSGRYQSGDFEDRYEARLREVIDAKLKGEGIDPVGEEEDRGNVIDLMAALKQSLGGGGETAKGKTAAKGNTAAAKPGQGKKKTAAAAPKTAAPKKAAAKPARKRA